MDQSIIESVRHDASVFFEGYGIRQNPVQCGRAHAGFAKWLLQTYGLQCQFWSIAEKDLPGDCDFAGREDDESFLIEPQTGTLIDLCATPSRGPYVGPNRYDLTKSLLWHLDIRNPRLQTVDEFANSIHHIGLYCPPKLQHKYPFCRVLGTNK